MASSTLTLEVSDITTFDEDSFTSAMAAASGVSADQISDAAVTFKSEVSYSFSTTGITVDEARNAIASANGVPVESVQVIDSGRRLEDVASPLSITSSASARQLSTSTFDVTITNPSTTTSQTAAEITTTLSSALPGVQVLSEPVNTVEITITYPSSDSAAAAAVSTVTGQSAAELTTTLSAAAPGITVVSAPVVTTTTEIVSILALAPSPPPPSPPPPAPPPAPPPMCRCDVVHGAASLFDPCLKIEGGLRHCYPPSAGVCPSEMTDCISVYDCTNKMRNKKCDKKKNKGFCDLSSANCVKKRGKCRKVRRKCKLSCGTCSS